jgi:hypothetical protein
MVFSAPTSSLLLLTAASAAAIAAAATEEALAQEGSFIPISRGCVLSLLTLTQMEGM